jgi:hypothetical protein
VGKLSRYCLDFRNGFPKTWEAPQQVGLLDFNSEVKDNDNDGVIMCDRYIEWPADPLKTSTKKTGQIGVNQYPARGGVYAMQSTALEADNSAVETISVVSPLSAGEVRRCDRPTVSAAFARRRANGYLIDQVGLFFGATDPVFASGNPPVWQVTITFLMYDVGPFTLGTMDVDAWTGEPMPLSENQIRWIQDRTNAIVSRFEPTPTATG